MTIGSRLPAIVVMILGLAAAILLVAGWGVAVGVGVLIGLALGLLIVLVALALAQRAGGSASFSWLSTGRGPTEPEAAMLQYGLDSMRVIGVDAGDLQRVIAVGARVEMGGVHVELMAVELRTDGGVATLVVHTRPPIGQVGHFAAVRVTDDVQTTYIAAGQGAGGSSPTTTRHEMRFAPAPPASAAVLRFNIDRFLDPYPGGSTPIEGPWSFEMELGP